MTREAFTRVFGEAAAAKWFDPLLATMRHYDITTPLREAHFLAQVAHESGAFRWVAELWGPTTAQARYEGRSDLGNAHPGDGYRFRGRGLIQLTGRANYTRYQSESGLPVVRNPDLLTDAWFAADVAGWYWNSRNLNARADRDDLEAVTRGVNGGLNGLQDRARYLALLRAALAPQVAPERPTVAVVEPSPAPPPLPEPTPVPQPEPSPPAEPDVAPVAPTHEPDPQDDDLDAPRRARRARTRRG